MGTSLSCTLLPNSLQRAANEMAASNFLKPYTLKFIPGLICALARLQLIIVANDWKHRLHMDSMMWTTISLFIDLFFLHLLQFALLSSWVFPLPLWGIQRVHGGLLQGWKWKIIMFTVRILQVSLALPVHSLSSKQILSDGRTNHQTPWQNNNLFKLIWEKYIFVLCAVKWTARLMYTLYTHIRTFVLNDHNLRILILISRPVYLPHTRRYLNDNVKVIFKKITFLNFFFLQLFLSFKKHSFKDA